MNMWLHNDIVIMIYLELHRYAMKGLLMEYKRTCNQGTNNCVYVKSHDSLDMFYYNHRYLNSNPNNIGYSIHNLYEHFYAYGHGRGRRCCETRVRLPKRYFFSSGLL